MGNCYQPQPPAIVVTLTIPLLTLDYPGHKEKPYRINVFICKFEDSRMHLFSYCQGCWFKVTCILYSGCGSLQWSHSRILHWHIIVTCSSRSFLCILTWQFSLVQKTSLKTQDTKCSCCKNKLEYALQLWFYSMCFANMGNTFLFLSSPFQSQPSFGHLMAKERIFLSVALSGKTS